MDRQTAIRKVLACLRMAASSNPNEAAAALRQARALMALHGLTAADTGDIRSAEGMTRCRGAAPVTSVVHLMNVIQRGFRCLALLSMRYVKGMQRTVVVFHGANADPQVAAYAFTVLRRQMERDKTKYTKRIRKRSNKDVRGEEFALGWVAAVAKLFPVEGWPEGRIAAIELAIQVQHGELTSVDARTASSKGKPRWSDRASGYEAGSKAQLHSGLDASKPLGIEDRRATP